MLCRRVAFMMTEVVGIFEKPVGVVEAQEVIDSVSRFDYVQRHEAIRRYSFAVPCVEAVNALVALSPLLEVGAGGGYWARILKEAGADVVATDMGKQSGYSKLWNGDNVLKMDAVSAVEAYPDRNVFVCWPSYRESWASEMAERIAVGRTLAYIGEPMRGCTADERFFEVLCDKFVETGGLRIPQWDGIHDVMEFHVRKDLNI